MREAMTLALACASGAVLGAVFFGGLWWTIGKAVSARQPALWFLGSLVLRMTIALTGFYFVSGGQGARLLLCLLGFFIAGRVAAWLTHPTRQGQARTGEEIGHAPHSR